MAEKKQGKKKEVKTAVKSPFSKDLTRRMDMKAKMVDLCLNKACEAEISAEYYDFIGSKEKSEASKAQFKVQADGLRNNAEQQKEMADFLESLQ